MPVLCWRHHTLVQALLSRGPLREAEFHSIFSDVTGKSPGTHQQLFNEYLRKINMELSYVRFELRACRSQYDGNVYYGVINNVADEQSKLGTKYTVPQIAFYKGIIEAIVQDATAHGSISKIDALNIQLENQAPSGVASQLQGGTSIVPPAFRNFSMAQKEKSVEEFVQDQWLCLTPDGNIGLGVRSFLDLRSWFHNNEVPPCDVCNEAGIKAELCPNESCTVRIHRYCLKTKFSNRRVERVCPGCRTEWPYVVPKAEAVEQGGLENELPQTQSQTEPPAEPSLRKRVRRSTGVEEDEHENELQEVTSLRKRVRRPRGAEQEDDSTVPSQPPTEPSTRKNLRSSRVVVEEEDDNFGGPSQPTTEPASTRLRSSRVVKGEDDSDGPTQNQPPSQPLPRKKLRSSKAVDIDTDGSGPSLSSTFSSTSRRTTRSSARLQTAS